MAKIEKKPEKVVLFVRISKEAMAYVDQRAKETQHSRSVFMDKLIQEAKKKNL